jgi:hypothetical protein
MVKSLGGVTVVSTVVDMIERGWENFLARPSGSLNIRFLIQPTVAAVMAGRAGLEDARLARPAFLRTALTDPRQRWRSERMERRAKRLPDRCGARRHLSVHCPTEYCHIYQEEALSPRPTNFLSH